MGWLQCKKTSESLSFHNTKIAKKKKRKKSSNEKTKRRNENKTCIQTKTNTNTGTESPDYAQHNYDIIYAASDNYGINHHNDNCSVPTPPNFANERITEENHLRYVLVRVIQDASLFPLADAWCNSGNVKLRIYPLLNLSPPEEITPCCRAR